MRITSSIVVATGVLATALTFAGARPADAGKACNRLKLGSPCIKSNDLKARLNLDEDGRDARLRLRDAAGENAVELNAGSANVTNLFSNDENASNGLVKAWAEIAADGTIVACWRCNTDPAVTRSIGAGEYEVDFTPLATDITGRPMSATIIDVEDGGSITIADRIADPSSVFVNTKGADGTDADRSFFLIIY